MRVLVISNDGVSDGYGRISMEVNKRLHQRGVEISAASLTYDGLLPAQMDGYPLPYWVASLQGKEVNGSLQGIIGAVQPDIIHVIQDAPYAQMVYYSSIDWTKYGFVITTPVDGVPVSKHWIKLFGLADGMMTISQFGVQAHKEQGITSILCHPGVDSNYFFPIEAAKRNHLRAHFNIAPQDFVLMTACQNQGRKAIPFALEAFFRFAQDKPRARYILDTERASPMGWDIINDVCDPEGWDVSKLIFRDELVGAGITSLADRYNMADAHTVLAFREGFGLPLLESMACGVCNLAMDYCSGTEIVDQGKGVVIPILPLRSKGSWGGAEDRFPDVDAMVEALENLYLNPSIRLHLAQKGMEWARSQTWDKAADTVQGVYRGVYELMQQRKAQTGSQPPPRPTLEEIVSANRALEPVEVPREVVDATQTMAQSIWVGEGAPTQVPNGVMWKPAHQIQFNPSQMGVVGQTRYGHPILISTQVGASANMSWSFYHSAQVPQDWIAPDLERWAADYDNGRTDQMPPEVQPDLIQRWNNGGGSGAKDVPPWGQYGEVKHDE